jgi:hypothetical protein
VHWFSAFFPWRDIPVAAVRDALRGLLGARLMDDVDTFRTSGTLYYYRVPRVA